MAYVNKIKKNNQEYDIHDTRIGGEIVQISTDGGETYGSGMALEEFIAKCENGDYAESVGAIARITKLINGQTMRIRLIGVNHDVLANTDLGELEPNGTKAKTTWQFYDMPIQKVNLGLPFEEEKTGDNLNGDEITIETAYPSNMHGYSSAVGLLNAMQEIFNSLPIVLQRAMKLVRKDFFIPEICNDDYGIFGSTASYIQNETDRYGSCVAAKLFCLSAAEVGMTHASNPNNKDDFPYDCEDSESNVIRLEGKRYAYFDETPQDNQGEEARNKRIRYYKGQAYWYWLRSPYVHHSYCWGRVYGGGNVGSDGTDGDDGVAPAFCI